MSRLHLSMAGTVNRRKARPLRIVSTRNYFAQSESSTSATVLVWEVRHLVRFAPSPCFGICLAIPPKYGSSGGEVAFTNNWTYQATIEYSGVIYPVTWGGAASQLVATTDTSLLISDPIANLVIAAAGTAWIKGRYTANNEASKKVPSGCVGVTALGSVNSQAVVHNGTGTALNTVGAVSSSAAFYSAANATALSGSSLFAPVVLGRYTVRQPAVMISGDSISRGFNEGTASTPGTAQGEEYGFLSRACADPDGTGRYVPYFNGGISGETASNYATLAKSAVRRQLLAYATHNIVGYGTVDFAAVADQAAADALVAATKANLSTIWGFGKSAGCKVYHSLMIPSTTDDNTTFFQTPGVNYAERTNMFTTFAKRKELNQYAIAQSGGATLDGYTEPNSVIEHDYFADQWTDGSGHEPSNKWVVDGSTNNWITNDGIHPISNGHALMVVPAKAVVARFAG